MIGSDIRSQGQNLDDAVQVRRRADGRVELVLTHTEGSYSSLIMSVEVAKVLVDLLLRACEPAAERRA